MEYDYSYWEQDGFHPAPDVCIVGAGLTGLNTGISILQKFPTTKVCIIDRTWLPLGASTRNAGFACFGSPTEILADIRAMGEKAALDLVSRRWNGLQILLSRIDPDTIGYENNGGYELVDSETWLKIANQLPRLNTLIKQSTGLETTFQEVTVPQGIEGFDHAVFNPHEGQLHPVKLVMQLQQLFKSLGGNIFAGIQVKRIEEKTDHALIHCMTSPPIKATNVVITTNAFAADLIPGIFVRGARNLVMVTTPVSDLQWKGTFHVDEGFIYFRNVGNRILLGGARNVDLESEYTTEFGENQKVKASLDEFLKAHFAKNQEIQIEYKWSGIIGVGETKSPIVQQISTHIWAGVRLSGMGVALSALIAEELATDMMKKSK